MFGKKKRERAEINVSELEIDADGASFLITGLPGEGAKTVHLRPGEKFEWGLSYDIGSPQQRGKYWQKDGIELLFTGKAKNGEFWACFQRHNRAFLPHCPSSLTVGYPKSGGSFFWPAE